MPKYEMMCEHCGVVIIEHPMSEDHPDHHEIGDGGKCNGKMTRYFGNMKTQVVSFVSSRGGGVDDWASKVAKGPENPTSEETGYPYR